MDSEQFKYILDNQTKWAEQYKIQKEQLRLDYSQKVMNSKWYGNSKEYQRLWKYGTPT